MARDDPSRDKRLAERYREGASIADLARLERCSRDVLKGRLTAVGCTIRRQGIPKGTVNAARAIRDDMIVAMYLDGKPLEEIAAAFNLKRSSIQSVLERRNVPRTRSPGRLAKASPAHGTGIGFVQEPRVWCSQCERSVSLVEGTNCRSQWCKA